MIRRAIASGIGVAAAALALSACGNSGGGGSTPASVPCSIAPATLAQLVYPAPNTTVNSANVSSVVVAVNAALPAGTFNFGFSAPSGYSGLTQNSATVITASQVPSPSATPSFANPVYESVSLVSFLPSATPSISVYLNNFNSTCTPAGPYGTFSTQ